MIEELLDAIGRHGPTTNIITAWVGGLAFQVALFVVALRRRRLLARWAGMEADQIRLASRPTPWPELCATVALAAPAVLLVLAVVDERGYWIAGLDPATEREWRGIMWHSASYHSTAVAALLYAPLLTASAVALGLASAYRSRADGLLRAALAPADRQQEASAWRAHPGPSGAAVVLALLAPVLCAAIPFLVGIISAYDHMLSNRVVATNPPENYQWMTSLWAVAKHRIFTGAMVGAGGLVLGAGVALLLLVVRGSARRRWRLAPTLPRWPHLTALRALVICSVCLAVAGGLLALALPLRAENSNPFPRPTNGLTSSREPAELKRLTSPLLRGPDPIEGIPACLSLAGESIHFEDKLVWSDDNRVEPGQLAAELAAYRSRSEDRARSDHLMVLVDARLLVKNLLPHLSTLSRAGYKGLYLLFINGEVYRRPRFGTLRRWVTTAAVVRLVREPGGGVKILRPDGRETFDALARRIVRLRRGGEVVGFVVQP